MLNFDLNWTRDGEVIYEYRAVEDRDIDHDSLYSDLMDGVMRGLDAFAASEVRDHGWSFKGFEKFGDLVDKEVLYPGESEGDGWNIIPDREKLQVAFDLLKTAVVDIMLTFDFDG